MAQSFSVDGHICGSIHLRPALATDESSLDMRELVLDVPQGSAVLLRRKVRKKLKLMKRTEESSKLASLRSSQIGQLSYYFVSYHVEYPFRRPAGHFQVDFLPFFSSLDLVQYLSCAKKGSFSFKSNTFSLGSFCTGPRFETEEGYGLFLETRYRLICYNNVPPNEIYQALKYIH